MMQFREPPFDINGARRRYHVCSVVDVDRQGITYSAYVQRRKEQGKLVRHYYAVVVPRTDSEGVGDVSFDKVLQDSLLAAGIPVREEETIVEEGITYHVIAKDDAVGGKVRGLPFVNKGLLMALLAVVIVVLLIVGC